MRTRLDELVEAADLNELLRAVDVLCSEREWDALLDLARKCEAAVERGKQLWPITAHIEYRLALEAPGPYAARTLRPEIGRFSHGPLTEVTASTHTWDELAPYVDTPQAAAYVAQERVIRGEDLSGDARTHPEILELPRALLPWEPTYCVATFARDHVEVAEPAEPVTPLRASHRKEGRVVDEPQLENALLDLVQAWTTESNGAARAAVVEGDAASAVSELTLEPFWLGPLEPAEAMQRMAWAAASGGAHGRRRGGALGRFAAWFAAAQLCGLEWPCAPEELGAALGDVRWFRWEEAEAEKGWVLRLAVEDPGSQWAVAIAATDLLESE